jgi:hypothetical protein
VNGREDFWFPVEMSQIPMFKLLGTADKDKRHVTVEGGHADFIHQRDVIQQVLDWLDRYLGPVTMKKMN